MSTTTADRRTWPLLALAVLVAALVAGCANMPLNKPSALSPAHHSSVEAP